MNRNETGAENQLSNKEVVCLKEIQFEGEYFWPVNERILKELAMRFRKPIPLMVGGKIIDEITRIVLPIQ